MPTTPNRISRVHPLTIAALCAVLYWPMAGHAQIADPLAPALTPTPTTWRLTSETFKLPGGEKMGMVGGDVLFDLSDHLRLGIGSYGSVRGDRGGFITLGVAGEVRKRLSPSWVSHAGLFVGAGGGRGGSSLSGGGLMLREDVGLTYESAGYGNFGFGVSHVQFPSGAISSTQPYVLYEYPFYSLLGQGWNSAHGGGTDDGADNLPAHGQEFSVVTRSYKIPSSVVRDSGLAQDSSLRLLGVQWLSYLDNHWFLQLEAEGAAGGQNSGYMQILAGAGYRLPLSSSTAIKLHAAAGPAGGGDVDTGGGLLLDAGVSLQQNLTRSTALELSIGEVRAPSASFRARSIAFQLTHRFALPDVASPDDVPQSALGGFDAEHLRVRVVNQTYFKADPQWRANHAGQSVSNLGVQLDYFVSPHWFLTGQGLAAYAGNAGAYMTGLVGAGTQRPLSERWFVEGEALVGAAGGGGLAVSGGLVGQVNAGIGYRLSKSLSLLATAGRIEASRGNFKANVAGLALAYQFTGFARK